MKVNIADSNNWRFWLPIIFLIKLPAYGLVLWWTTRYYPESISGLFIGIADSNTFYFGLDSFIAGDGYGLPCRMPGLGLHYVPLAYVFGPEIAKQIVILIQMAIACFSTYFLGRIAEKVVPSKSVFVWTVLLYSISLVPSYFDLAGSADSLHLSLLIILVYYLIYRYKETSFNYLLSGILISWGIFVKEIFVVILPMVLLFIASKANFKVFTQKFISGSSILMLPVLLFMGLWTLRNWNAYQQFIPIRGPINWCYSSITPEQQKINELLKRWGEDLGRFKAHAKWFISPSYSIEDFPYDKDNFTSEYNLDSLVALKQANMAWTAKKKELGAGNLDSLNQNILNTVSRYTQSFKEEHPFQYYIGWRFELLRKLMVPTHFDNLPLPSFANMSAFQKLCKVYNFALYVLANTIGVLLLFFWVVKLRKFDLYFVAFIPLAVIFLLTFILGFIEQRYHLTAYPFLLIFLASGVSFMFQILKSKLIGLSSKVVN